MKNPNFVLAGNMQKPKSAAGQLYKAGFRPEGAEGNATAKVMTLAGGARPAILNVPNLGAFV